MDSADSSDAAASEAPFNTETLPVRTLRQIARHIEADPLVCDSVLSLWAAGRQVRHELHRILKPLGLSDIKFATLLSLYALAPQPSNPVDLAYHAGVTRSSMTDVLDQLEASGWIHRERYQQDRRVIHVTLNAPGREQVEKAIRVFLSAVQTLGKSLSPGERTALPDACSLLSHVARFRPE